MFLHLRLETGFTKLSALCDFSCFLSQLLFKHFLNACFLSCKLANPLCNTIDALKSNSVLTVSDEGVFGLKNLICYHLILMYLPLSICREI